ncbi:MAG: alpha amylase family protein, partial [Armatimonadota bacterium]|nr:alpha amylase family protein [Armatimonadota bacterium]
YPWVSTAWVRAGYAPLLDFLAVGLYYRPLTVWEALRRGANPTYSLEGGAMLARSLVNERIPVVATLYLPHFVGSPERLRQALRIARVQTAGVMLFDLVYLTDELWEALPGR